MPGQDYVETDHPSHTHVVHTEHIADDNPHATGLKMVTAHRCLVHVLDLMPCPHGWTYDAFSRALAIDDAGAMAAHAGKQA